METIAIHTEFIKLQDLLQLAGLAGTGGQAKAMILEGLASVNGEICLQRGRKIRPGDAVTCQDREMTVAYGA